MSRRREFADGIVRVCIVACAIIIKFVYIFWYFRVQHSNCSCSCKEDTRCGAEGQGRGAQFISLLCGKFICQKIECSNLIELCGTHIETHERTTKKM